MILVLSMLLITIIVFTCVFLHLFIRLGDAEGCITLLEVKANYFEQSEKTLRESVDLQTKCIRNLNDIVKKSVGNKEPVEPDTKALLGGWIAEEPEPPKKQPQQIDTFRMLKLISSLNNYKNNRAALYPWSQAELSQVLGPYGIREERMNEKIFS